jgi:hypothetical protein
LLLSAQSVFQLYILFIILGTLLGLNLDVLNSKETPLTNVMHADSGLGREGEF